MKNVGDTSWYIPERNADLFCAFMEKLDEATHIKLPDIIVSVVRSPAKRFYVGDDRAVDIVSRMLNGGNLDNMRPERKRMFTEIYNRCIVMMEHGIAKPLKEIVYDVIRQPAPEFYLTPGSAKVILHYIRNKNGRG